jgi:hypothetical protein
MTPATRVQPRHATHARRVERLLAPVSDLPVSECPCYGSATKRHSARLVGPVHDRITPVPQRVASGRDRADGAQRDTLRQVPEARHPHRYVFERKEAFFRLTPRRPAFHE